MSTFKELRDCVVGAKSNSLNVSRERLMVILEAAEQPKEFWDRDMKLLHKIGAIDILKKILKDGPEPPGGSHEFFQAFSRCPKLKVK